ncbi:MAG TPA: hypothetical protein VKM94_25710 [Blastocatellia bacterium]|nr:hypothetical protein [Blastocatellia bacterium]
MASVSSAFRQRFYHLKVLFSFWGEAQVFAAGHGFAVVLDPEKAGPTLCGGGIGAVGWPGAFGGWWQADLNDGSVLIFLAHNMIELDQLANGIGLGAYEAILQFHTLASALPR